MIDIHSHILPGVDDGASNDNEALDILRMAVDGGVTTQVLTPHIHLGRYNNTKADLGQRFIVFKEKVYKSSQTSAIVSDSHNLKSRRSDLGLIWHVCDLFDKQRMETVTHQLLENI